MTLSPPGSGPAENAADLKEPYFRSRRLPAPGSAGGGGFSLVEVTISIGIVAFAFIAVVGLLPAGLRTAQDGQEQGRATEILNTAASAVFGQRSLGTAGGNRSYAFGDWLSDDPQTNPITYGVTQGGQEYEFAVMETGAIRPRTDTTSPVRYKLFIRVTPPATVDRPVKVDLSVAWPGTAEWDGTKKEWTKNQGHVEALLYVNPPDSI